MGRARRGASSATSTSSSTSTFPPPRLIAFGAVDFAGALCRIARATGWRPFVVDPRERFAQAARFPDAEEVVAAWPEEAFARLGGIDRATAIAVLTHDPKLDDAALVLALRSDAGYIGAMGSRRAQASRRERLLALGIAEAELARISAPIGLDLGALTAEETALSIMAEIVAVKHGHAGGRLRARARPDPRGRRVTGSATAAGLVLAAGEGRRFGGPKQLARLDGRPLVEHALAALAELERVVVVLGARADEVRAGADLGARRGRGVRRLGGGHGRVAALRARGAGRRRRGGVALADQPVITAAVVARVRAAAGRAARAVYAGRPGHPVVLRAAAAGAGGRAARRRRLPRPAGRRRGGRVRGPGGPADIDTREDLEVVRR